MSNVINSTLYELPTPDDPKCPSSGNPLEFSEIERLYMRTLKQVLSRCHELLSYWKTRQHPVVTMKERYNTFLMAHPLFRERISPRENKLRLLWLVSHASDAKLITIDLYNYLYYGIFRPEFGLVRSAYGADLDIGELCALVHLLDLMKSDYLNPTDENKDDEDKDDKDDKDDEDKDDKDDEDKGKDDEDKDDKNDEDKDDEDKDDDDKDKDDDDKDESPKTPISAHLDPTECLNTPMSIPPKSPPTIGSNHYVKTYKPRDVNLTYTPYK